MALPTGTYLDIDHEGGNLTEWDSTIETDCTLSASTDQAHEGTYSMKYVQDGGTGTVGVARAAFTGSEPADGDTYYVFGAIYIAASQLQTSTTWRFLRFRNTSAGNRLAINFDVDSGGEVSAIDVLGHATNYGGNWTDQSCSINTGEWNTFQIAYKVSATVGGWEVWINGVSVGNSGYTRNTSGAIGDFDQVSWGSDQGNDGIATDGVFYLDSIKVHDELVEDVSTSSVVSFFAGMI